MTIDGKLHPHSFVDGASIKRNVQVDSERNSGLTITSSITGLSVLKSTGSEFWGYIKDPYTTLPETKDRILSSDVDIKWVWRHFSSLEEVKMHAAQFDAGFAAAKSATFDVFATTLSMSAQDTLYKMTKRFLDNVPSAESVEYSWPNKHYIEIGKEMHNPIPSSNFLCLIPHFAF